jgi:serine/threonine protein kinase/dienelactone hydrolase
MNETLPTDTTPRLGVIEELGVIQEIDPVCDRFEADWRARRKPRIEAYLFEVSESARPALFQELLRVEIACRRGQGETLLLREYEQRFPRHAEWIATLLDAPLPGAEPPPAPPQAGRYRLEEKIGHGGMGDVYRAHDSAFNRSLAVKVLKEEYKDRPEFERRFLEEAQITGQLQHPGIPPVHEIGRLPDGRPFLAMKRIKGRTLADLLKERESGPTPQSDLPRYLAIFEQVCQTLAYAHSHGVIHRDLKPSNVMVDAFGEVQVMDWGLAKLVVPTNADRPRAEDSSSTAIATIQPAKTAESSQVGNVVGTLAYMAPEQALGHVHELDARSDVFGLGAILCAILTGQPPYTARSGSELHQQAAQADLADAFARLDACGADTDLVQLAKTCMARRKEERPADAGMVAVAIGAYETTKTERYRQAEVERAAAEVKVREERKRRRVTVALAAAVMGLAVLGTSWAWWYQHSVEARRTKTEREIRLALAEVNAHMDEGWKHKENPGRWKASIDRADAAIKQARAELVNGIASDDVIEDLIRAEAAVREADHLCVLCCKLDGISLKLHASPRNPPKNSLLAKEYREALSGFGIDLGDMELAAEAVRSSPVRSAITAALDDWSSVATDVQERQQIQKLLREIEPDTNTLRTQWRKALAKRDVSALARLARESRTQSLPLATILQMARDLEHLEQWQAFAEFLFQRLGYADPIAQVIADSLKSQGRNTPERPKADREDRLGSATRKNVQIESDIVYCDSVTPPLKLMLARPNREGTFGPFPVIICFHGGGWMKGEKETNTDLLIELASHGYVAVAVSHRFAPKHKFPAQIHDAKRAVRWLRQNAGRFEIDPDRFAAMGYSSGGNLACLLGSSSAKDGLDGVEGDIKETDPSSRVQAVICCYGLTDLTAAYESCGKLKFGVATRLALSKYLGGVPTDLGVGALYDKASPISYVGEHTCPICLIHGKADEFVPWEQSKSYEHKLTQKGCVVKLLLLDGVGHNFDLEKEKEAFAFALEFLNKHLAKRK